MTKLIDIGPAASGSATETVRVYYEGQVARVFAADLGSMPGELNYSWPVFDWVTPRTPIHARLSGKGRHRRRRVVVGLVRGR